MPTTSKNNKSASILQKISSIAKERNYKSYKNELFYSKNQGPTVLITAAIHGNEKAGSFAIYSYIKRSDPPKDISLYLMPIINHYGFDHNTRENGQRRDLNRAFNKDLDNDETDRLETIVKKIKPDLVINLHEDGTHEGCYIYVPYDEMREDADEILKSASKAIPTNKNKSIFGDPADNGVILQSHLINRPKNKHSFEFYLFKNNIPYITFETPSDESIKNRAAAMILAIDATLGRTT